MNEGESIVWILQIGACAATLFYTGRLLHHLWITDAVDIEATKLKLLLLKMDSEGTFTSGNPAWDFYWTLAEVVQRDAGRMSFFTIIAEGLRRDDDLEIAWPRGAPRELDVAVGCMMERVALALFQRPLILLPIGWIGLLSRSAADRVTKGKVAVEGMYFDRARQMAPAT